MFRDEARTDTTFAWVAEWNDREGRVLLRAEADLGWWLKAGKVAGGQGCWDFIIVLLFCYLIVACNLHIS